MHIKVLILQSIRRVMLIEVIEIYTSLLLENCLIMLIAFVVLCISHFYIPCIISVETMIYDLIASTPQLLSAHYNV